MFQNLAPVFFLRKCQDLPTHRGTIKLRARSKPTHSRSAALGLPLFFRNAAAAFGFFVEVSVFFVVFGFSFGKQRRFRGFEGKAGKEVLGDCLLFFDRGEGIFVFTKEIMIHHDDEM